MTDLKDQILDAALMHVVFDGWSEATLTAAIADTGANEAEARALFPKGAVDLAMGFHRRGDDAMVAALTPAALAGMKIREKITHAIRLRLELMELDKEAKEDDVTVEEKGIKVFVDRKSMEKLDGSRVDYVEALQGAGFKIDNPNSTKSCGCGNSFR